MRHCHCFWPILYKEISIVTLGCRMMVTRGRRLTIFWPMTVRYSSPVVSSEAQKHPLIATIVSWLQRCITCILCVPLKYGVKVSGCGDTRSEWRAGWQVQYYSNKLLSGPRVITLRCRKLVASHSQRHTSIGAKYSSSRPEGQTTVAHSRHNFNTW